jgi:hypothetical protein
MTVPTMRFALYLAVSVSGVAGCYPVPVWAQSSQANADYAEPVVVCEVTDARLNEASGLLASRRNPGYYYTHNDSQGESHVFVLDRSGRICLTIRLSGATNVDWEDIALAPGSESGGYDVCVADIGDNKARRADITIYRFAEPLLDAATRGAGVLDVTPGVFRGRYAGGPRNAEGFVVDAAGHGWVLSKRLDGKCDAYRLEAPWKTDAVNVLQRVGSLRFPVGVVPLATMVTAADVAPDSSRLATRSYVGGWEWELPAGKDADCLAAAFKQAPKALRLATEVQGEAICYSADGKAVLTVSEGTPTTLYESRRQEQAEPQP